MVIIASSMMSQLLVGFVKERDVIEGLVVRITDRRTTRHSIIFFFK